MAKFLVKIQNSVFPVRINRARYRNGDELEIYDSELNENIMEVVKVIEEGSPQDNDPFKELEGKNVEELKAYADENNIDIGNASSLNGIIKKIREAAEKAE